MTLIKQPGRLKWRVLIAAPLSAKIIDRAGLSVSPLLLFEEFPNPQR